jgi:glycerophosphoryl diester phosphodiesterase
VGNTPEAVPTAVAAGADLIEADVHLYRRRLEVRHTKTLGVLPWLWDRWYLIPAAGDRLSLAALVRVIPADTTLMLDLKGWHPWLGRTVATAMEDVAPGRKYAVASRQWSMLTAFESLDHVQIIHSARGPREASGLPRRLARHRTDAVCMHQQLLTHPRWVAQARRLSPVLLTWPVTSHAAAREALARGANGLIVDGVDLLADLSARHSTS